MRILALEPYYGGSHKAFLDGWSPRSCHQWTQLDLPPYKWKWRMRHAAITMARQVSRRYQQGDRWDLIFCSDMLNLAEFLGLVKDGLHGLPSIAYFHENQLTYPVQHPDERDYHFVLTNITTALAATEVWFNSAYHRDVFLGAIPEFLKRMPDHQPCGVAECIREKSKVMPPGIDPFSARPQRGPGGSLHILWAARWEYDKDPQAFFGALRILQSQGIAFRVSVIGEQFRDAPAVFDSARVEFAEHIERWGYQASQGDYRAALLEADVFVSTALHEFFGFSVVEAIAAGAYPLLPHRLAYPEILGALTDEQEFYYDGTPEQLAGKLAALAVRFREKALWQGKPNLAAPAVEQFGWKNRRPALDQAVEQLRVTA